MGKIRDVSAVAPVSQAAMYDETRSVRVEAIRTLAQIGRAEAYPALRTIAETDPSKSMRRAATKAIQVIERKEEKRASRPPKKK